MRYEVNAHKYGRPIIRKDCPMQGLPELPKHQWIRLNNRPMALDNAISLAKTCEYHTVVNEWFTTKIVFDNGKEPEPLR